eukprot:Unigene12364_Nuclearia_a/m.37576 Unigene12364_Nuclearia_a/g.37576  ORF Unigene12364_Nuclearia_a/g.37576 Unigene12364_Nuclearia_a/m.37576 type:complete len:328 (-) Unigene12364_Nuclearia_a:74-1057(-)
MLDVVVGAVLGWLWAACAVFGAVALVTYALPVLAYGWLLAPQDLRKRYDAQWAIVTGGSSGIGKAIAQKLASQGINVAIAALDDKLLKEAMSDLPKEFPKVTFRAVPVDLSQGDYLGKIASMTDDLPIQLVFNNAGYITTGFFFENSLDRNMRNYEVNATAAVKLSHHFINKMLDRKQRGLIAFTSSSAGFIPTPLAAMYASTKAFLTTFAASISAEVKSFGIDVVVVHPSPISTRFYNNADGMQAVIASASLGQPPRVIADAIFTAAGRFTVVDQGLVTQAMKVFLAKMLDWNFFAEVMTHVAPFTGDFKGFDQRREPRPRASQRS